MNALTTDRIKRALNEWQPACIVATLTDDTRQTLARGGPKTPWRPVLHALDELPWVTLELLDKKGALLGAPVKNDSAATEMENLPSLSSRTTEVGQIAQIVTGSVRELSTLLAAQTKPAFEALTQANRDAHELAAMWRERAEAADRRATKAEAEARRASDELRSATTTMTDAAAAMVAAREDKPEGWMQAVQALPQLATIAMQLTPIVKGLLGTGAAPAAAAVVPKPPIGVVR